MSIIRDYRAGGWQGGRQLITTTEYGSHPNLTFPYIYPGYPQATPEGTWKYRIKDYFRAYASPTDSFKDWGGLLSGRARYRSAMQQAHDPFAFAEAVARAGYATDPKYAQSIKRMMVQISETAQKHTLWKVDGMLLIPVVVASLGLLTWFIALRLRKPIDIIDE